MEEDYLAERGLLDEVKAASAVRATRLDELMRLYGDAVDQVEGANPEDLLTLDALGLLLSPGTVDETRGGEGGEAGEGRATLRREPNGDLIFSATDGRDFSPDGRDADLVTLVQGLIKDMSAVGGTVRNLPGQYPPEWEPTIRKAVGLKRSGAFFESARGYVDRARQGGEIYLRAGFFVESDPDPNSSPPSLRSASARSRSMGGRAGRAWLLGPALWRPAVAADPRGESLGQGAT